MGPDHEKTTLRARVEAAVDALGPEERRRQAEALVSALDQWWSSAGFEVVLATLPLGPEPDLTPALERWLARGKSLALARTGPGRSLDFAFVDSLRGPWEPRPFGLREPSRTAPPWAAGRPTLCLVPGVAFGPVSGRVARLGRGAGYYDRWLALHGSEVFSLGFGYAVQWVSEVPTEAHDQPLYAWLGPEGVTVGSEGRTLIPSQNTEKIS